MNRQDTVVRDIAAKELREVLASTEALLSAIGDEGGESVNELRNRLEKTVADVRRELGKSFFETARERYHQVRDTAVSVNRFTRRYPWLAVAIGTGIGVLIGRIMSPGPNESTD
jgi:ElaB/YqjD/DUF883 family membrane-anchored ribosome-binding protein